MTNEMTGAPDEAQLSENGNTAKTSELTPSSDDAGTKSSPVPPPKKPRNWKLFFLTWTAILVLFLTCLFFGYRFLGSSTHRGTVQRVYEKSAEYRVEFATLEGEVMVLGNKEINFPYLKHATADLHAQLNRLSESGDVVDVRVWGFRQSWLSLFPNVVDVEHVRSQSDRRRLEAEMVADFVLEELRALELVEGDQEEVRSRLIRATEKGLTSVRRKERSSKGREGLKTDSHR